VKTALSTVLGTPATAAAQYATTTASAGAQATFNRLIARGWSSAATV